MLASEELSSFCWSMYAFRPPKPYTWLRHLLTGSRSGGASSFMDFSPDTGRWQP